VVANTLLSERTNQLTILQKDFEKRSSVQDTLEENYRKQKVSVRMVFLCSCFGFSDTCKGIWLEKSLVVLIVLSVYAYFLANKPKTMVFSKEQRKLLQRRQTTDDVESWHLVVLMHCRQYS